MDAAIQQLTEAFQCPVCYELISSRHKSRSLPCGHGNVCEKDLGVLWRQSQQNGSHFKCPSQGCSIPNCPPVDKLPYNWAFISAGDNVEDLIAAHGSSSPVLSGPSKRSLQIIDSMSGMSCDTCGRDVISNAHALYATLTQSFDLSEADACSGTQRKAIDVSTRHAQEAEARITVLKKIMAGQGLVMTFLKL